VTKPKKPESCPKSPEQFFYRVEKMSGDFHRVTADNYHTDRIYIRQDRGGVAEVEDAWLIFYNRGDEVARYRVSLLAGWSREAKPGVTA
jgi:hypothetical protein